MWIETDLAYLAGLIDGEGYVSLLRKEERRSGGYYFTWKFLFCSTSKELAAWVSTTFGGILYENKPGIKATKPSYDVRWRAFELENLLPVIVPYLKLKRRQAEIVLEYLQMPRGRWARTNVHRQRMAEMQNECSVLNHNCGKGLNLQVEVANAATA
jgi:hypothetical protein